MRLSTWLWRALLAIVVLAPLPLGAQRPLAWTALGLGIAAVGLAWSAAVARGLVAAPVSPQRLRWMLAAFGLLVAWILVQLCPWVPVHWQHPIWREAAAALPDGAPGAITLDPALTRTALLRLLTDATLFWVALQLGRNGSRAREALAWLAVASAAYALYAIVAYATGGDRVLWIEKWAYVGDATGTFVGRNAFAAFAGLGVLVFVAMACEQLARLRDVRLRDGPHAAVRHLLLRAGPLLAGACTSATALLLSHSRGGLLATCAGLLVLLASIWVGSAQRRAVAGTALLVAIGGTLLLATGGHATLTRFVGNGDLTGDRVHLYELTARAVADAPLTGHGFGAFATMFRIYRDPSLPRPVVYDFAHNTHLELAAELGLPATLAFYAVWAAALLRCIAGALHRRRDRIYSCLALAAAALFGTHALVDFSIQIPANAVAMTLLLALGVAQSWSSNEPTERPAR